MLTYVRCLLIAAVAAMPVLALAAGPYLFQEMFDDGSLDGTAIISGTWGVENGQLHNLGAPGRVDYLATRPVSAADYESAATVRMTGGWASAGVITRFVDSSHFYYATLDALAVGAGEPSRSLALYKVSPSATEADSLLSGTLYPGASYHLLGGAPFPTQLDQTYELSVAAVGNTFSIAVDGVVIFTVVDYDDAYTIRSRGLVLLSNGGGLRQLARSSAETQ